MEAMRSSALLASLLALPVLTLAACGDEEVAPSPTSATTSTSSGSGGEGGGTGGSGGQGGTPIPGPGPAFDRFCEGAPYDANLTPATVMPLGQAYLGVVQADPPFPIGTLETMKVIPDHPFRVETIRVAFGKGGGPARIRLMTTFGRSYPGGFPELDTDGVNVVPPMDIDVPADVDPEVPLELDVSALGVYLEPTQHYILVHEQLVDDGPLVAAEAVAPEAYSRALLFVPKEDLPYGLDANYRMELVGSYFCAWDEPKRFFGERSDVPWGEDASASATIADFDGDGHDDLVVNAGGPIAYRGDGLGGFTQPANDPFPDAPKASMLVFADVDNDGDDDAFASTYVTMDGDGDHVTILGGDCDDTNKFVKPTAAEISNGYDDNCDGLVDDGLDVTDADLDGFSIAAGDCDDTKTDAFPGAPELLDSRDNDCDGAVDQTFVNKVLLNDGTGQYYELLASGVEVLDSSTAAGFGDGDVDGIVDLYWGNWLLHYPEDPAQQDRYFEGNGDGTFTDAQANAGMVLAKPYSPYGLEWIDYNNDALPDLFVGNYHLYPNLLWKNLGGGVFTNVAEEAGVAHDDIPSPYPQYKGGHTYGGDWFDFDLDGDFDFYMCNLAHPRVQPWSDPSMFVVNQGAPDFTFVNQREAMGFVYDEGDVNAAAADFDHDGDEDLAIASLYTGHYSRLYRNDGDHFTDITYETNTAVHDAVSVVWSDVDEDGDMDLFIADRAGAPYVHLFTNRVGNTKHWVELKLSGTTTNRSAVGARVTVKAGGKTMMREVSGGNGLQNTQKSRWLHFGLADATAIDEVTVRWIGGATETISGLGVDGRFTVAEGSGAAVPAP
jgi:hypothetical protein